MKKLIWVIQVIMILLSCKSQPNRQAADQNKLSVLIFQDSVIVYNSIFEKNTAYKKYLHTEPEKLREVIEQNRLKYGFQSEILLKIAIVVGADFGDHIHYMADISTQNSGPDLKIADITETEEQFFRVLPFKRSFIDSFNKPLALDLKMPKDVPDEEKIINEENAFTVIILSDKGGWAYTGTNYGSGFLYDTEELGQMLEKKNKETGDSLAVIIKPAKSASYKATVDILDQMTIHHIKYYTIVKLSKEEEAYFNSPDAFEPPEPVKIVTPGSVSTQEMPKDNAFLIEIRKDRSVWYQIISKVTKMAPQKINNPITKNLKEIIAGYEKLATDGPKTYLIKGDGNSTKYSDFEQVIEALKQNNIFKYNLVTSQ